MNILKLEFVTGEVFSNLRAKDTELRNTEGTRKTAACNHDKYDSKDQVSHPYKVDIDKIIRMLAFKSGIELHRDVRTLPDCEIRGCKIQ